MQRKQQIIEPQNILSWRGSLRTIKSNSWLQTGPCNNQTMSLIKKKVLLLFIYKTTKKKSLKSRMVSPTPQSTCRTESMWLMTFHSEELRHGHGEEESTKLRMGAHGDAMLILHRRKHISRFACVIKPVIKAVRQQTAPRSLWEVPGGPRSWPAQWLNPTYVYFFPAQELKRHKWK